MTEQRYNSKRVILVKPETVPGLDSLPEPANCVYAETLTVKPLNVKTIDRNTMKPFMGSDVKVVASFDAQIDIEIALAMGGDANGVPTPGAVPAYDALIRGCGMARSTSANAITGTAQGGTKNLLKLAAGASATDDIYAGLSVRIGVASGTAQAPGSANKALVKLAATDAEHTGTLLAGSTDSILNFAASASDEDDYYVGKTVVVAAESSVISAYNGTTKAATLTTPLSGAPGLVTYTVQHVDDYYVGMLAQVDHFNGTVVSAGYSVSSVNDIYLPLSVVGANNVQGCDIDVTTGTVIEKRRISVYDVNTRRATLQTKIGTAPTNTSTFVISEQRKIIASNGTTREITLKSPLKFATTAATPYAITVERLITEYNGTNKVASITPPLTRTPAATWTYRMNPFVKYSPVSEGHLSNTFYYYEDGALHSFTYAKGNLARDYASQTIPMAKLSYQGLVERYEDAAFPAFDRKAWVEPLPVNYENTKNLYLHGWAGMAADKISIDQGNEVVHTDCPGAQRISIKDRKAKGSLTMEAPKQSEFDVYNAVRNMITGPLLFTHGPMGNQIAEFCKNVQLLSPSTSEKEGVIMVTVELNIPPYGTGNNETVMILQ
jgi:hypothetical protein